MEHGVIEALSALEKEFRLVEGYDVVPAGTYWTVVENATLGAVLHTGSPKMVWTLRILPSDHFGLQLRRSLVITSDTLRWLKRDLHMCGLGVESLQDLPSNLDNLLNLKLLVRKHSRAVHILACDDGVGNEGHLFLDLMDQRGKEYLDQQLRTGIHSRNQQEFLAVVDHFVRKYQCPRPDRAYLEDSRSGSILFSTDL